MKTDNLNVPKLRFPEFSEAGEWVEKELGEIIVLEYGSPLPEQKRNGGLIPVVGSNGIVGYHDNALITAPAIVIGRKGTAGQINWIASDCYPIDTTFYVKNKNPENYLLFFLKLTLDKIKLENFRDSGAVPGINRNEIHSIKIALPDFPEQQKIAACLSSLDELITAQSQKLAALKKHKKGLMQQLFPAEGQTVPTLRFPEFRHDWEENILGFISNNISSGKDNNDPLGEYDLYGSTGIIGKTSSCTYNGKFILVARVGANAGLLTKVNGQFGVTDNTLVIQLKNIENIDTIFYYLDNLNLNRFIFGSGQPLITGGQLKSLKIYLPCDAEQQKIAACLSSLDELITAHSQKLAALKKHKKGLMQQLFPASDEVNG